MTKKRKRLPAWPRANTDRFSQIVSGIVPTERGCLEWPSKSSNREYRQYRIEAGGRKLMVHRIAWQVANGPIGNGLLVCHHCDNPSCVNVRHLFLGTNQDNIRDAKAKGRLATGDRSGPRLYIHKRPRGENNGRAKLTRSQVAAIKFMCGAGVTITEAARRFGVNPTTTSKIMRGVSWRPAPPAPAYEARKGQR